MKSYTCPRCEEVFNSPRKLGDHWKAHPEHNPKRGGPGPARQSDPSPGPVSLTGWRARVDAAERRAVKAEQALGTAQARLYYLEGEVNGLRHALKISRGGFSNDDD